MTKFNLNNEIYVKLKPEGFTHYRNTWNKYMPEDRKQPMQYFKDKADEEGYVRFQAWEFMQIFRSTISMGSSPIFETTVKLNEKDFEQIEVCENISL